MKTVNLKQEKIALDKLIGRARKEPVLVLTSDGEEFILSKADDFDKEVEHFAIAIHYRSFSKKGHSAEARNSTLFTSDK